MKYCKQFGFAQIFVLAGMLLVSAALPVATKLLQQNQENRSNAAAACSSYNNKPSACSSAGCSYETLIKSCSPKITKKTTTKTCTYNCTAWTTCNSSGKQTCKAQTKPQPGCTGGTTKIGTTQNCTPAKTTTTKTTPKTCTSFTYTDWTPASCPSSGRQTRTVKTSSPSGCTGGTRVTSRNCSPPTPTKSATKTTCSYICTKWGSCSSGWQTCTTDSKLSTSQPNCTGGRKIGTRQKCTPATSSSNTTTKKADGSTCSYNSECTSGYCNLTIKKCATKVTKTTTATDTTKTTATTKDCVCNTTTAGKCDLGSPAWKDPNGTNGFYTWSCTGSNCNPKNCSIKKTADTTKTYYLYDSSKCTPTTSLSICQTTTCYSSLAACQLGNSAKTTTITGCSSSACGKCDSTNCGKGNDCLWGYNGSSTMYCYPKTAAIPVTDKCVVDGKTWNNNAAICSNNIAYICKSGVTRKVEDCGTRGCDVDGTCKETVCSVSNCGGCVLPSACSSAGCYWEPLTKTCSKLTTLKGSCSCGSFPGECKQGHTSTPILNEWTGEWGWRCGPAEDMSITCNAVNCAAKYKALPKELGSGCVQNSDCNSGICVNKLCTSGVLGSPCVNNDDCISGNKCGYGNSLIIKQCTYGAAGYYCSDNSQCDSGICKDNKCTQASSKNNGEACGDNNECESKKCLKNYCVSANSECNPYGNSGNNCPDGSICIWTAIGDKFMCSNDSCSRIGEKRCDNNQTKVCLSTKIWSSPLETCVDGCNEITQTCKDFSTTTNCYEITDYSRCESNPNCFLLSGSFCRNKGKVNDTCQFKEMCLTGYCNSKTGLCDLKSIPVDGVCGKGSGKCDSGTAVPTGFVDKVFYWYCAGTGGGKDSGGCSEKITVNRCNPSVDKNTCYNSFYAATCVAGDWVFKACGGYGGNFCINGECQAISVPDKENNPCIPDFYESDGMSISPYTCPDGLTCKKGKCTKGEKQSLTPCKGLNSTTRTTFTTLGGIYTSATMCDKGLSCNRQTGFCETPVSVAIPKSGNESCRTDSECLSGFCLAKNSGNYAPMTCSSITEEAYKQQLLIRGLLVAGGYIALPIAAVPLIEGVGAALTGTLGASAWEFLQNHPGVMTGLKALGFVGDIGDVAECLSSQDPTGCFGVFMPGGVIDDVYDLANSGKTAAKLTGNFGKGIDSLTETAESAANVASDLTQLPKKIDIGFGDMTEELVGDATKLANNVSNELGGKSVVDLTVDPTIISNDVAKELKNNLDPLSKYYVDISSPPKVPGSTKIDQKRLRDYLNSIQDPNQREALTLLAWGVDTQHITHEQFVATLNKRTIPSVNTIIGGREYLAIVQEDKSNTWVLKLAHKNLEQKPSVVIGQFLEMTETSQAVTFLTQNPSIRTVVMFDDASYSGMQLGDYVMKLSKNANASGIKDLEVVIAVPYIAPLAESKFKYNKYDSKVTVADHITMPSAERLFTSDQLDKLCLIVSDFKRTLTTFDHKVADCASTLNLPFYLVSKGGFIPDPISVYKKQGF